MSNGTLKQVEINSYVVEVLMFPSMVDGSPQVSASILSTEPWFQARTDTMSGSEEMNRILGVPENTPHVARCTVSPKWSHEPAVATLLAAITALDACGLGLVWEVNPYPQATKADRKRFASWLKEQGFVALDHGVMYRAASKCVTEVHSPPVQA